MRLVFVKVSVNYYLIYGGFPKQFEFAGKEAIIRYLDDKKKLLRRKQNFLQAKERLAAGKLL